MQKNARTKLSAKIGVFSDGNSRDDGELTNAEIGARHEFGVLSEGLPRRSFLRGPLELKRKELLETADSVIRSNISKPDGDRKMLELIGIAGEAIVQEGFGTGGFGLWKPLSAVTISEKGNSQILIDSRQLRQSVISKVDRK